MEVLQKTQYIIVCAVLVVLCLEASPCFGFTSFVFGDSLVDAGNNDYIFTLSKADSPPYGIDFKASGGRPTGRFTNGRTISDIIGQELGAKSFPPPYLAPDTQASSILRGINYASGASGILDKTGFLFIGRVPLREQVNNFEQSRSYMVNVMGEISTREFLKKAIFSLTIGSNDVLNYVQPSIPFFAQDKVSPNMYQDFMVSNLTVQLKRLHELGARKFIVVGVGPLGCIPFIRAINLLPSGHCFGEVNDVIQGFKDAEAPCCGGYFPPFVCFMSRNSSSSLCGDRSTYVFWDAYHPTEAANVIIAKRLLDGDEKYYAVDISAKANRFLDLFYLATTQSSTLLLDIFGGTRLLYMIDE
ncbi:hypothetical protein ACLB2K_048389 [Fragaria x ananassa]